MGAKFSIEIRKRRVLKSQIYLFGGSIFQCMLVVVVVLFSKIFFLQFIYISMCIYRYCPTLFLWSKYIIHLNSQNTNWKRIFQLFLKMQFYTVNCVFFSQIVQEDDKLLFCWIIQQSSMNNIAHIALS